VNRDAQLDVQGSAPAAAAATVPAKRSIDDHLEESESDDTDDLDAVMSSLRDMKVGKGVVFNVETGLQVEAFRRWQAGEDPLKTAFAASRSVMATRPFVPPQRRPSGRLSVTPLAADRTLADTAGESKPFQPCLAEKVS
jgi:hypothetical protein